MLIQPEKGQFPYVSGAAALPRQGRAGQGRTRQGGMSQTGCMLHAPNECDGCVLPGLGPCRRVPTPTTRIPTPAQVAGISDILPLGSKGKRHRLKVFWYYRPEEGLGGRKVPGVRAGRGRKGARGHGVLRWRQLPNASVGQLKAFDPPVAPPPPPQLFHGTDELFRSDHSDIIESETVLSKCRICSLEEYMVRIGVLSAGNQRQSKTRQSWLGGGAGLRE